MAWTLVAALCIVAFVIVAQFSKTFRIFQKRAFVYPSGADIDQILPPEIIETILTNTDMNTLYACSLVSKYWKHHVDKDHVFTEVLEKEKAPRVTLAELAEDLKEPNLQVNWLTYHEDHYKPIWHIQDGRYIKSAGKKLIDAQYSSVSKIAKVIRDKAKKYIVRSRLRYSFESSGTYYFYIPESNEFITFYSHVLPAHVKQNLRYGAELEIVEELNHLWGKSNIQLENPASARMIERRTFLGGVPIDGSIFAMMILIFMPCVIKDFWSASADTKYYVNVLFASIGLIGAFIASVLTSYDGVRINQGATRSRARLCFGLGVAGIILLSGYFYQYAIEFGFYCGIEAGLVLYGLLLRIMHDDKHPNERHIFIISFCLLVSIIDWKLTVDAVKNGAFWYSLLYNLALHILIWLWTTFINVCYSILLSGKFDRNALSVDKQIRIVFSWAVVGILFVACAAPNTLRKVIL